MDSYWLLASQADSPKITQISYSHSSGNDSTHSSGYSSGVIYISTPYGILALEDVGGTVARVIENAYNAGKTVYTSEGTRQINDNKGYLPRGREGYSWTLYF